MNPTRVGEKRITLKSRAEYLDPLLGANIRKARKMLGIQQKELAGKIGLDQSTLCKIEQGTRSVPVWLLLSAGDALDIPYWWFIEGIPEKMIDRPDAV